MSKFRKSNLGIHSLASGEIIEHGSREHRGYLPPNYALRRKALAAAAITGVIISGVAIADVVKGEEEQIPCIVTIKPGDTLYGFAERIAPNHIYDEIGYILQTNPDIESAYDLYPGGKIIVETDQDTCDNL